MSLETWLALFAAGWAISLSPGAGAVAAMASGLRHGLRRGYWTTLGLQLGVLLQLAVVGAGLGAALAASGTAFEAIRWFGVAYLLYLGARLWRQPASASQLPGSGAAAESPRSMVLKGLLVNAGNPKAVVFMLAVVPQFVTATAPLLPQYLVIALTLVAVDMVVMGGYTAFAARLLRYLRDPTHVGRVNKLFGALLIGAAGLLAAFRRG